MKVDQDKATNRGFKIKEHEVFTYEVDKRGLSAVYIKRALDVDGVHTYPLSV